MRACLGLLLKTFGNALPFVHCVRLTALFSAVESLMLGRKLSVTGLGRSLVTKTRVKDSIKRMDRLVGNAHLHRERHGFYETVANIVVGMTPRPVIIVDWSDLSHDRKFQLLRAAVPGGGRALTVYEEVHTLEDLDNNRIHQRFLMHLKKILPPGCCPIVVTDAGFRGPWFKAVAALGWDWVGRVRNRVYVRFEASSEWVLCNSLHVQATRTARCLGKAMLARTNPVRCALYLVRRKKQGRVRYTHFAKRARSSTSKKSERREREPWLIATSMAADNHQAEKIIKIYKARMQIEESFRDLKNQRHGWSIRESRTNSLERFEILLLVGLIATLAVWLIGKAAVLRDAHLDYQANTHQRTPVLSAFFLGCQICRRDDLVLHFREFREAISALTNRLESAYAL